MRLTVLCIIALLTGCGYSATRDNPEDVQFVMVSMSEAGFVYKLVTGGTEICKLTSFGIELQGLDYELSFDGDVCLLEVKNGSAHSE